MAREATGLGWKLAGLGCFLVTVLGVIGMVVWDTAWLGWIALRFGGLLFVTGVGAWLSSG